MKLPKNIVVYALFCFTFLAGLTFFMPHSVKTQGQFKKEVKETWAFLKKEDFQKRKQPSKYDYTIAKIKEIPHGHYFKQNAKFFISVGLILVVMAGIGLVLRKNRRHL